jgi:hypothetical protein
MTDTGARLAEITELEAKDVDLENAILHSRPAQPSLSDGATTQ